MIQPDTGKEKGIWMVFLCQFIATTSKLYSFLWDKCWEKGRYKNGRKRTEKEERSENNWGHCEDIIYSRVGQSGSQLSYQRPSHPSPLGTLIELMAFPSWVGKLVAWIVQSAIEIYLLADSGTRLYLKGLLPVTVTNILPKTLRDGGKLEIQGFVIHRIQNVCLLIFLFF